MIRQMLDADGLAAGVAAVADQLAVKRKDLDVRRAVRNLPFRSAGSCAA
jgi:hypothetical protein